MKILTIFVALLVISGIGAIIYFAMMDITVEQKDVVKEIPHERFTKIQ